MTANDSERARQQSPIDYGTLMQRRIRRVLLISSSYDAYTIEEDGSIDVQISRLRTRLRDNGREPQLIKTVRGDGYVLATDVRPQFVRPALPVDAPIMPGK